MKLGFINNLKETRNNRGSALLMTAMILASLLVVALTAANVVVSQVIIGRTQERSTLAYYAAEAGAERFLWEARKNPGFTLPDSNQTDIFGTINLSNGSFYNVDYGTSTPNLYATSTGSFINTKRSVFLSF